MSLYERVPQIELSPEFGNRPLSAMQPRDYLHLLLDLLYFPQRVRDYVTRVAFHEQGESRAPRAVQGEAWRGWATSNPIQIEFIFMLGVVCMLAVGVVVSLAGFLSAWLAQTPIPFDGITFAMLIGIGVSLGLLILGILFNAEGHVVVMGMPMGMAIGLFLLAFDVAPRYGLDAGFPSLLLLSALCGIAFGLAASGFFAAASFGWNNLTTQLGIAAVIGPLIAIAVGYFGWSDSIVNAPNSTETLSTALGEIIAIGMTAAAFFLLAALRVDDFLLHARYPGQSPSQADWTRIPRVTSIHLDSLHDHITAWLDHDWKRGMDNIASLWRYTAQQETIRRALHEVLSGAPVSTTSIGKRASRNPARAANRALAAGQAETPVQQVAAKAAARQTERQFELIGHIADHPHAYPWDMVTYDNPARSAIVWSAGRSNAGKAATASTYVQRRMKRQQIRQRALSRGPAINLPDKTTEQALTAGFWYLDRGYIADAAAAFRKAPATSFIKEMQSIVDALDVLSSEENLLANASMKLPRRPAQPRRPETWIALDKIQQTVRFARVARQSTQEAKREQAADQARRLLNELAADKNATRVELRHIRRLAELWQADLDEWLNQPAARQAGSGEPMRPVDNPFLFAEPLRKGQMFVDRDGELNELKLAWSSDNLQPVVVFGQPLIGKTSLLFAARNANAHVELAWFHLGHSNRDRASVPQMLAAICSAVQQATILDVFSLGGTRNNAVPNVERANDPYADTERFIRHACTLLAPRNLILVMDDFDAVQQLFTTQNDLHHFLDFLEHLFQTIKNFNVVFVSQYAPVFFEETARHSFAGSARMHHVGPLQRQHIAALLRPADFPLYFADDAVDEVMRLSGGHPYLAQLLAHSVVRAYNRLVAENKPDYRPEPLIEYDDILAVLGEPEVVQRSQILFMRMDALARRVGNRADSLLDAIAESPNGMARADLLAQLNSTTPREESSVDTALYRLKRYGMIEEDTAGKWRVRNELWRQWEETRTPRALPDNRLDTLPEPPVESAEDATQEDGREIDAAPVVESGEAITPAVAESHADTDPEAHPEPDLSITEDVTNDVVQEVELIRDEEIVAFSEDDAEIATDLNQAAAARIITLDPADGYFDDFVEEPQQTSAPETAVAEPAAAARAASNYVPPQRILPDRLSYAPKSGPVLPDAALKDIDE